MKAKNTPSRKLSLRSPRSVISKRDYLHKHAQLGCGQWVRHKQLFSFQNYLYCACIVGAVYLFQYCLTLSREVLHLFSAFVTGASQMDPTGCRDGAVVRALASHQCGPGSIPRSGVRFGLSLMVLYSAPRGFLRELRFPISSKIKI